MVPAHNMSCQPPRNPHTRKFILAERCACTLERALSQTTYAHEQEDWLRGPGKLPPYERAKQLLLGENHFESTCGFFHMYVTSNKCFTCFTIFVSLLNFFFPKQTRTKVLLPATVPHSPLRPRSFKNLLGNKAQGGEVMRLSPVILIPISFQNL